MVDFSKLKKSRGTSGIANLAKEVQTLSAKQSFKDKDERFWQVTRDKSGNGSALIRFLPAPPSRVIDGKEVPEDMPFIRRWTHAFQGPGGWYIENSLTSIGLQDPVYEANRELYATKDEEDEKKAKSQKRKLEFISNILVITDPANPENDGKVFLFKYGKKVFDKINHLMNPESKIRKKEPVNPFDPWTGANFELVVNIVDDYPNYDKSEFEAPSSLFGGDDKKIEAMWKTQHSLNQFLDPSQYLSYDELAKKYKRVTTPSSALRRTVEDEGGSGEKVETTSSKAEKASGKAAGKSAAKAATPPAEDTDGGEDNTDDGEPELSDTDFSDVEHLLKS